MIAASFWSLLAPAIDLAEKNKTYGANGEYAFIPVAAGFLLGAIFVFGTDKIISYLGINSPHMMIALTHTNKDKADIAIDDTENSLKYEKTGSTGKQKLIILYLFILITFFFFLGSVKIINEHTTTIGMDSFSDCLNVQHGATSRRRRKTSELNNKPNEVFFFVITFFLNIHCVKL